MRGGGGGGDSAAGGTAFGRSSAVPSSPALMNGWKDAAASLLRHPGGFGNATVHSLLAFIQMHAGLHSVTEFCACAHVSRLRLNELPPPSLVAPLVFLLQSLGYPEHDRLGHRPGDTLVINVGLWGKGATGSSLHSHSAKSAGPFAAWWAAELLRGQSSRVAPLPLLVYRESSPQHWMRSAAGYDASAQHALRGKRCVAPDPASVASRPPMAHDVHFVQAARSVLDGTHVAVLPIFGPTSARADEHPVQRFYRTSATTRATPSPGTAVDPDCTHFCQGGAALRFWNGALLALIRAASKRRAAERRTGASETQFVLDGTGMRRVDQVLRAPYWPVRVTTAL